MAQVSNTTLREYETIYILRPEIDDEASVTMMKKMIDFVASKEGKHLQLTNWGRKKLMWERKTGRTTYTKGLFVHHRYLAQPDFVAQYEQVLKFDEDCIHRQTVVLNAKVNLDVVESGEDLFKAVPVQRDVKPTRGSAPEANV